MKIAEEQLQLSRQLHEQHESHAAIQFSNSKVHSQYRLYAIAPLMQATTNCMCTFGFGFVSLPT